MSRAIAFLILLVLFVGINAPDASAGHLKLCSVQGRALDQAGRVLSRAENRLRQTEDRYARLEDNYNHRQMGYEIRVSQAQANLEFTRANISARNADCVIRSIFWWGGTSCWSRSYSANIGQEARARSTVRAAESRLRNFKVYSQGAIYRESQRLLDARTVVNSATTEANLAQAAYSQCIATVPAV